MKKISQIGSLLKKNYRTYSNELLELLQIKGFIDLRPSFLEILIYVSENSTPTIKEIGAACGLKKQTMTSHLNELEKRGYLKRITDLSDRRVQIVILTEYGQRFKVNLIEATSELEEKYMNVLGSVELDRVALMLDNFYQNITINN